MFSTEVVFALFTTPLLIAVIAVVFFPRVVGRIPTLANLVPKPGIVCIGDNLTFGTGAHLGITGPKGFAELAGRGNYCTRLGQLLRNFKVMNFAFPNATVINVDGTMYITTPEFSKVVKQSPKVAVVMLGTVDSSESNWGHSGTLAMTFRQQLHSLVENLMHLTSLQLVVLCVPPIIAEDDISGSGLGELDDKSKQRAQIVLDAVKQVLTDMRGVIQIKQTLMSSKAQWSNKKIVLVDMHKALVVQQRLNQQQEFESLARAEKRALQKVAKRKKQDKLSVPSTTQVFQKNKAGDTGVGLSQIGSSVVADLLASTISRELSLSVRIDCSNNKLNKID